MKTINDMIKKIFGAGEMVLMACSLVCICGYIAAFIIGGETAVAMDAFIYTKVFPVLFFIAVSLAFLAMVSVYITGKHTMTFDVKKKEN